MNMTPYQLIDPVVGVLPMRKQGDKRLQMWTLPLKIVLQDGRIDSGVSWLQHGGNVIEPFGRTNITLPTQWRTDVLLRAPGARVYSPTGGKVVNASGTGITIEERFTSGWSYWHALSGLDTVLIKSGTPVTRGTPLGTVRDRPLAWQAKISYPDEEYLERHRRFKELALRYPGVLAVQRMWAFWLATQDNDAVDSWLTSTEQRGELSPFNKAVVEIGEWGEFVSREVVDTLERSVDAGVSYAGRMADKVTPDATSPWPWLLGGLVVGGGLLMALTVGGKR